MKQVKTKEETGEKEKEKGEKMPEKNKYIRFISREEEKKRKSITTYLFSMCALRLSLSFLFLFSPFFPH